MVRGSTPKFSIGIYGDWGTGKTTLMKMVEKKLNTFLKDEEFFWDELVNNSSDISRLKSFLKEYYKVDWIENSQFENDNGNKTIRIYGADKVRETDERGTYLDKSIHSLSLSLNDKKNKGTIIIDGKEIRQFDGKRVNNRSKISLQENEILTVWFNAWRYEREDQFSLIALMKTIAYAMSELPTYQEVKKVLLRGLGIIGKDFLRNVALKYAMTEKGLEELETSLLPKMELLSKVDKDTVYFDGLYKIEEEMEKISKTHKVVVFIDDLDRCSPTTALQVLESIKVFLGMEGFIYIIGLSVNTISKLIDLAYKDQIKGEAYIRKIIQLPITIPDWNNVDVIQNLVQNLSSQLNGDYPRLVDKYKEVIAKAVELNPREVKRFINSFIVAHQIFSGNPQVKPEELLVVQALKFRWDKFYPYISGDDPAFRQAVQEYAKLSIDERSKKISDRKKDTENPLKKYENIIFGFESDEKLWDFLSDNKVGGVIFSIKDWKVYRQVIETLKEEKELIREARPVETENLLVVMLQEGRIEEFNKARAKSDFEVLELSGANLSGANLSRAILSRAILSGAFLSGANLSDANLSGAFLSRANLSGANLSRADLSRANLSGADLSDANLSRADLSRANLIDAELLGADLRRTKNLPITKEEAKSRGAIVD